MKVSDLASVYRVLSALDQPYALLVIVGTDDFFREDCCERYLEWWKKKSPGGDIKTISASDLLVHRGLLQQGLSLFGTKTLYVVDELSSIKGKKGSELVSVVRQAQEECYFLFSDAEDGPKDLLADAESRGAVFALPTLKPWERQPFVVGWIQAFVKKREKTIDKEAASLLAQAFSDDRKGLKQELEKLCVYRLTDPVISRGDVEEVGTVELHPHMWQLLDGLLAGDAKMMAECLIQAHGMHDIAVLRFMKNQLERLLTALEEGGPSRSRAQERQLAAARKKGVPTIVSWINRLKMHEVAVRSGMEESEDGALLPFFLSLCS